MCTIKFQHYKNYYFLFFFGNFSISKQLEVLKSSSTALSQLESGLSEFKKALVQDRSTLQGLEGALKKGQPTPDDLENVKLVAKLLSEKVNVSQEQVSS